MKTVATLALLVWSGLACAQTADELLNAGKNPENVTNFGIEALWAYVMAGEKK